MMTRGSVNVLGCRADILGTNCNKLLKLKFNGAGVVAAGGGGGGGGAGGGVVAFSFTACN